MSSLSLVKENKNKKNEDNTNDAIEKKKKKKTRKCVAGQQQVRQSFRQSKYTLELGDKVTLIEVRRGARGLVFPL